MASVSLHPAIDNGVQPAVKGFEGGFLECLCAQDKVRVNVQSPTLFNHACGCSKCWKPAGATFAVIAVAPKETVNVTANGHKLQVVDPTATIQRHACTECNTHLFGRIENQDHVFYGLDFVHTELSPQKGWAAPEFAAFVSSVIETGTPPKQMTDIRARFSELGLEAYDCLSPTLMDLISTHVAKRNGTHQG